MNTKIRKALDIMEMIAYFGTVFAIPFASPTGIVKLMVVCLVFYLAKRIFMDEKVYTYNKMDWYILGFVGAFLVSTLFSKTWITSSLEYLLYVTIVAFAFALRNLITSDLKVKQLMHLITASTALVSLYGFYQAIFIKPIQSEWLDPNARNEITFRIYSTLDNPNLLAIFLIMVIPIAMFMFLNEEKKIVKALYAAAILMFVICLSFTFSRTGMLGLTATLVTFLFFYNIKYILYLAVISACAVPLLPTALLGRIKSFQSADSTVEYRFKIWETTFQMIKDNWLTGVGYGSGAYMNEYSSYLGKTKVVAHSHNTILQICAESGIIGILAFFAFVIGVFYNYIRTILKSQNKMQKLILTMGTSMLAGFLVNGITEHGFFYYKITAMFYIIFLIASQYVGKVSLDEDVK